MIDTKPRRGFWLLLIVFLAGIGFLIGWQKHMLWLAIVLALVGAALVWLWWIMMRVAIFTFVGALVGGVLLGILRSNLWFVGALAGAVLGFYLGWRWRKPVLLPKKT